ncbi:S8 family serine peptidase [Miniphocaeibacter halophilus]|uniref:S8 family serine peptidase n=1 Tax=Miniphocaeibacter halophilus TaxID=2931922 RepID=A0AC61MSP6_9FIRM|nr:S8 family serine peptidase [Miniphocaeibacter halophilus]QQK07338.1 S8 family serine peptidase [Miniphocaeibacter halophilus]
MKKLLSKILLAAILLTSFNINTSYAKENKIEDSLTDKINNNETVDVLVDIKSTEEIKTVVDLKDSKEKNISDREKYINEIENNAKKSQKEIIDFLEENLKNENIKEYESFYITNTLHIVGNGKTIKELAKNENVSYVEENKETKLNTENNLFDESELASNNRWNFKNTKIDEVYSKYNLKGSGVVIGFLDSGVDYKHRELFDNWRGNTDGVEYSWFDVYNKSEYPEDGEMSGHGTAIAGVAVGKTVGVAPEAQWIAARAFQGKRTKNSDILKAAEWFLAPGGRADMAPDIINNSWGENTNSRWFDKMLASWIAAGITPVFASGNNQNGETKAGSIEYPASSLDVISVGAVDEGNMIGYFSKKGPSNLDNSKSIIKPEVVAPGVGVYTSEPGDIYSFWTGTSIAAPNVSGVIALMLEANRNLTVSELKNIVSVTAKPTTDSKNQVSPNMTYGYGLVNALEAVELAYNYSNYSNIKRIAGLNRNVTATEIAKNFYSETDTVYITNGNLYADGLSMGSLTKADNGPLLLADKDSIDTNLDSTLKLLSPSKIVIIGGNNAVSSKVEKDLKNYTSNVERISGSSRVDTAIEIAKKVRQSNKTKNIFLVNGYIEADSINIVSVSSRDGVPVLFTDQNKLPSQVKNYINKENIKNVTIVGGENTVGSNVVRELKNTGVTVNRISGSDRYATGVEVNKIYHQESNTVFCANGVNIADALSVGPVAGRLGAQIQILPKDNIPQSINSYYSGKTTEDYYILGGENSISKINAYNLYKLFQ